MKLNLKRFTLSQSTATLLLIVITFITLGIVAGIMNYNFHIANEQRDVSISLTKAIHQSEERLQKEATRNITNLILQNQYIIKNTTSTNLKNTFFNRDNINLILNVERTILNGNTNITKGIDKLLNATSSLRK